MPGWSELPGCEGVRTWELQRGDIDKRFGPKFGGPEGLDLLKKLMCLDWRRRINAIDALQHPYFKSRPLPARPEDLPKYDDSHELDARRRGHEKQRALPPAPAGGTVGMGPDEWNGSGPPGRYGDGYGYSDRGAPRGYGRDRGPPGVPPPPRGGYDERRGRPPPVDAGPPPGRVPTWKQDRDARGPPPPVNGGHHLPPRPSDLPPRQDFPSRGPPPGPPPTRGVGGGANVDTYIPSYSHADPGARPYTGGGGGRRGSRESAYRDPDAPPPRYRDADVPHRDRGYRDQDAPPYRDRGYGEPRRTRSRSPDRDRGQRENDARRERLRERERDMYRR